MNVPTLNIIATPGAYAACPNVPEFAFSPYHFDDAHLESDAERLNYEKHAPFQGPIAPPSITNPRKLHAKRVLSEADQAHHDLLPYAKRFTHPVNTNRRPPIGTTVPLEGLGHFLARAEEIQAIARTQFLELPTAQQELGAISLSSSSGDDDDDGIEVGDDLIERHASRYGTAYVMPEQALLDRIEWEHFVLACSSSVSIAWRKSATSPTGRTLKTNDKRITVDHLTAIAPRMLDILGDRCIDDIEDARDRASYYKRLDWSLMTPDQQDAWTLRSAPVQAYLDPEKGSPIIDDWGDTLDVIALRDEDTIGAFVTATPPPARPASGPQELGLHDTFRGVATYEPSETQLERWVESYDSIQNWIPQR